MQLNWCEHDLYYGNFFIGSVVPWYHGHFKKNRYKIIIMTSSRGESLGVVENEVDGRIRLETYASTLLLK